MRCNPVLVTAAMILAGCLQKLSGESHGCAATPETAARHAIGDAGSPTSSITGGYRVEDAQVDPVMNRIWVRVRRCDAPDAPLLLVPLRVNLAGAAQRTQQAVTSLVIAKAEAPGTGTSPGAPPKIEVHAGDAVRVFFVSAAIHMELDATANGQAALGEPLQVTLKQRSDEPPHRMLGILRADHRVEVQP